MITLIVKPCVFYVITGSMITLIVKALCVLCDHRFNDNFNCEALCVLCDHRFNDNFNLTDVEAGITLIN